MLLHPYQYMKEAALWCGLFRTGASIYLTRCQHQDRLQFHVNSTWLFSFVSTRYNLLNFVMFSIQCLNKGELWCDLQWYYTFTMHIYGSLGIQCVLCMKFPVLWLDKQYQYHWSLTCEQCLVSFRHFTRIKVIIRTFQIHLLKSEHKTYEDVMLLGFAWFI